ncbi:MAG: hypothetical protein ISN64_01280 [Rickettsia sp.]|nr:hypothetical protein [Rickettsia sp.]
MGPKTKEEGPKSFAPSKKEIKWKERSSNLKMQSIKQVANESAGITIYRIDLCPISENYVVL